MTIHNVEDLVIWQLSRKLIGEIYSLMRQNQDWGFRDQVQRAAVSIMNNIAEGFQKHRFTKDNKTFINYLTISYGSCGEVRSMLYLAEDLGYISADDAQRLRQNCISIEFKIENFIKSLQTTQPLRNVKPNTSNQ